MNAKEMFEKLGYKLKMYDDEIDYRKDDKCIEFQLWHNMIEVHDDEHFSSEITMDELKAINAQAKELGWYD